jgi:inorganic pyrophosphatase
MGSKHPKYDMIYPVNYGYIPNTKSLDNEELDCYLLSVNEKVDRYKGTCIAIIKRLDDNDDKFVIVPKGINLTDEEIEKEIDFQEKYFKHIIIRR